MKSLISAYLADVEEALIKGDSTEHTHRPALKKLVEEIEDDLIATNEPKRIRCGAPDFIITQRAIPLGYIECKDVGTNLDDAQSSDQLLRYRSSLRNLILTNYLEFRLYRNGEFLDSVVLGTIQSNDRIRRNGEAAERFSKLFEGFLSAAVPTISTASELADRMARFARLIHDLIQKAFIEEGDVGDLHGQLAAFQQVLIADLSAEQFADMYAQTIAYGLFAARCNHDGEGFTRERAGSELPKTNPFLRRLFNTIAGPDLDERISWAVDDLSLLLAKADIAAILADFGHTTGRDDPVVHFYESFLAIYDPKLRELRGVYYTPEPIVDFMVRSVDKLLQTEFNLSEGLADRSVVKLKRAKIGSKGKKPIQESYETHKVQILDPACGTGTFLHAVTANIQSHFSENKGLWPSYVAQHLLPRLYGFELLMAPYAVAHMKLGIQLRESGYDFSTDERLRVFLTNTLEEAHEMTGLPLFTQWLAEEAAAAGEVKQNFPIMVMLGNPPYSGHSANKGNWIAGLMQDYKKSPALKKPGQAKWLSDDYVKFIRFAQWRIEQTGYGILAFITNHSFLDNPTFLDMRASLMSSFDELYFLDLHGSAKRKETTPNGGRDENVFDIQQGVAISLLIKKSKRAPKSIVRRADIWGPRSTKYDWLNKNDVFSSVWEDVTPVASPWLFVKQNADLVEEYKKYWSVADIFSPNGDPAIGIVTTHDDFAISWTKDEAIEKVSKLLNTNSEEEARSVFRLCTQDQWKYADAKRELAEGEWKEAAVQILYRPFDVRWTIWNSNVAVHLRRRVMNHFRSVPNVGLIVNRQVTGAFQHAFVSSMPISDCAISTKSKERSYLLPLYIYDQVPEGFFEGASSTRRPNINTKFLEFLSNQLPDVVVSPEIILNYIYAILFAPGYRIRYEQPLQGNFPRIPITSDSETFDKLQKIGARLVELHLLKKQVKTSVTYPRSGDSKVEKVNFKRHADRGSTGRVEINDSQYFDNVPVEVWEYEIGSMQVAFKWLNARKGRCLTHDELQLYLRLTAVIQETIAIQEELEEAVPSWPLS